MTPELAMIANVVTKARTRVDNALETAPSDQSAKVVTSQIAIAARRVFAAWDELDPVLNTFASKVAEIRGNDRLTPTSQRDDVAALTTTTNGQLTTLIATMRTEAAGAVAILDRFDRFPRPQPVNESQYAALAAMHAKWQMVLDRLDTDAARHRIVQFVADAIIAEDALALWALTADDWLSLYSESRGIEFPLLVHGIDNATAPHLGPQAAESRRLRRVVDDGYALTTVAPTAEHYTSMTIEHVVNNPQLAGFARSTVQ